MKYIRFIFWFLVFGGVFAFLQVRHAFHFFFVEQHQLFQNTWPYISDNLFQPGGLAFVLSGFLVQFFLLPYMGALITALLLTLVSLFTCLILRRIAPRIDWFVISLSPAIALLFIQYDFNYLLSGTVAFLLMLMVLWGVLHLSDFKIRLMAHAVAVLVLFYLAGPVSLLYASAVTVYELFGKSPGRYLVLLVLLEALAIGFGSVWFQVYPKYEFAFLPDAYYHSKMAPRFEIYYSWIGIVALFAFALLVRNRETKGKKRYISSGIQAVLIVALCVWGIPKYKNEKSYMVKELDYYCRTSQWDKILERCNGPLTNYLYMCYVNIALCEKGELAEKAFSFDQRGLRGIIVEWNRTIAVSVLLSDIYFSVNHLAPAQEMAFEAYVGSISNGQPRMLKRLVQTNLIYGAYPVAEKYINILENTYCYKDWAKEQRKFLYNDKAVEDDPLLGVKRKSLASVNTLSKLNGLDFDLMHIAEQNPAYNSTIEYIGVTYLLAKDMPRFKSLVETYYGTDVLPVLPKSFQEALITLTEAEPEQWANYRIPEELTERFKSYKKQVLANKNNPSALPSLLRNAFGDTYWYYFMFK